MPESRPTTHPNHVRLDLPLIRSHDGREIGTLTLIRNNTWRFYAPDGHRYANPQLEDVVTVSLIGPDGEQLSWHEVPTAMLLSPPDEQAHDAH